MRHTPTDDLQQHTASIPAVAAHSLPPRRRLLLLAVLLPIVVATTNQIVFDATPHHVLRSWLYPWLAFTTAMLSWCAGRYLYPAGLRWLLFVWCLLLLDILTAAACQGGRVDPDAGYLLVAAQVNFVILWAILGSSSWQVRLPTVLVAAAMIITLCTYSLTNSWAAEAWLLTLYLTAIIGGALCMGLRLFGFRLRAANDLPNNARDLAPAQSLQFGLRHMFIWATAAVPVLLVARAVDLTFFVPWIDGESIFAAALLGNVFATLNLIAIWCVLGAGWRFARIALLLVSPLPIAVGLTAYSDHLLTVYGRWPNIPILDIVIHMRDEWYGWLWINTALQAALLLFLRASGYLLLRTPRPASASA